ncbi:(2Fe-2S)-binding protein (plasmid) [Ensifer adhaerens]|uniref:(2Fe-2S)-binding protein n=1 Tax=Ensifer adhaerens TaxID=106592 RepID=UPI001CBFCC9E|nr:(2Fe-2S)-binding protein [Ensifer adhaerens]MBZ7927344.1 (2Fe-2S)-binding protein [Ensifer adhaerens]UAX98352.1 (2Fe-2S)-binding protein [Ensifer adhaerens]UAY05735.1 (2Fe-2S)-binding protein [Ensifer adhaerens]UAY13113.1 (2Fe-2S)-binding protein [Ensifer adhaerens]
MKLNINGTEHAFDGDPEMPLLWFVRDVLGLKGTKFGCGAAQCGACTMHVDGVAIRSCITPASSIEGQEVTTIEGISGKVADAVRAAWVELDVPQCGYCQSGQIMTAVELLTDNPNPSDTDVTAAMDGNLCRCNTYHRIQAGVQKAAQIMGGE